MNLTARFVDLSDYSQLRNSLLSLISLLKERDEKTVVTGEPGKAGGVEIPIPRLQREEKWLCGLQAIDLVDLVAEADSTALHLSWLTGKAAMRMMILSHQ